MYKPLNNLVLVKPLKPKKKSILLANDLEDSMPDRGKVIAHGSKVTEVKVGQIVIFDRVRCDNFRDKTGRLEYLFIPEDLIQAIIS